MKLVVATDAWHPQVNGVVRALSTTVDQLRARGCTVELVEPSRFRTIACPTYPEIRLALGCARAVAADLDRQQPDAVHIATEGPIGWAVRNWCIRRGRRFTTSFHTRFPDYVAMRSGIPAGWIWPVLRRFHGPSERTFAVTPVLARELEERGIGPVHHWPLGVDTALFNPCVKPHPELASLERPILLNVGRVAVEKNIEAFLACDARGTKVVVGDGPALRALRQEYPQVRFLGLRQGAELASCYAAADLFVFPSRTDTFGLVVIEALASGVPVAAFPEAAPLSILGRDGLGVHGGQRRIGAVDGRLARAIRRGLSADRVAAVAEGRRYAWDRCTDAFVDGLAVADSHSPDCGSATAGKLIARAA